MASKPAAAPAADEYTSWHGDFAGNATDGILLLLGTLLTVCALSGRWWMLWHTLFWTAFASLVFFMSLHLEYNTQADLERRNERAAAFGNPKPRRNY